VVAAATAVAKARATREGTIWALGHDGRPMKRRFGEADMYALEQAIAAHALVANGGCP